MFSQVFVCPQSASWLLVRCHPCYGEVGTHHTGMLSLFLITLNCAKTLSICFKNGKRRVMSNSRKSTSLPSD